MVNGHESGKKHACPDCTFCQWCSDDRCSLCLRQGCGRTRKLSLQEQIALYDAINCGAAQPPPEGDDPK